MSFSKISQTVLLLLGVLSYQSIQAQNKYDWSGFYGGFQVGTADYSSSFLLDNSSTAEHFNQNTTNRVYGLQAGYNMLFDRTLLGFEFSDGDNANSQYASSIAVTIPNRTRNTRIDKYQTLSLRAGHAFDDLLLYSKMGVAATKYSYKGYDTSANAVTSYSDSHQIGWVAGLGAEYALDKNITLGIEYDYLKFGIKNSKIFVMPSYTGTPNFYASSVSFGMMLARLNFKF